MGGQPFGAATGALIAAAATVHAAYTIAAVVMAATAICARVGLSTADVDG